MDYKVNDIKQDEPKFSLEQLINRATSLGIIGEMDAYHAHRLMKEEKYIDFTHDLLMGTFDEVARMQKVIKDAYDLIKAQEENDRKANEERRTRV